MRGEGKCVRENAAKRSLRSDFADLLHPAEKRRSRNPHLPGNLIRRVSLRPEPYDTYKIPVRFFQTAKDPGKLRGIQHARRCHILCPQIETVFQKPVQADDRGLTIPGGLPIGAGITAVGLRTDDKSLPGPGNSATGTAVGVLIPSFLLFWFVLPVYKKRGNKSAFIAEMFPRSLTELPAAYAAVVLRQYSVSLIL